MHHRSVSDTTHQPADHDAFQLTLAAARESEARLRLAIEASGIGTFHWRIDDDRIESDPRMLAMLGLPPGRTFSLAELVDTLVHPDDRVRVADAFARAFDRDGTPTLREDIRVLYADGSVRWLAVTGQTAFEGTRSGMSGVAEDITDRKRREADLALLDQISDDCARLSSPAAIMEAVGARLGAYLAVSAVCLVEVADAQDELRIVHMWNAAGAPPRPQSVRISDFVNARFRRAARAGHTLVVHDTETDPRTDAAAHATIGVRSFMSVPFVRAHAWGFMLTVCDSRPHMWGDDEISLFRQLADRVFARLEHALAEQALADDLRDTQLLHELSVRLVFDSDTQAFYDAIVAAAISITGAGGGCLYLLDADPNQLTPLASRGYDAPVFHCCGRLDMASHNSCRLALMSGRRAVLHFDDEAVANPAESARPLVEAGIRSVQSTPLVTRAGRTVGMLSTHWSEARRTLSSHEVRFLDLLARQAAETIEWRRTEHALRESQQRLSAELADTQLLQRLSALLIEGQASAALYETLVDAAKQIMRSDYATMQALDPARGARGELRLIASRGLDDRSKTRFEWVRPDAATSCARALKMGTRIIVPDITRCDFMDGTIDQQALLEAGIQSSQTTPLVSRAGKTLGMITTHWARSHQPSERDFRLLDILARQAADLLERTQAEEALRRNESQLKDADRRKDEFLATLAHELRNPLAPLRTSLEVIRLADNTREAVEEARVMMEEQVGLLVRLVDDLLDVSRITSGKIRLQRRSTDLATLVATAVQANQAALDAGQVSLGIVMPDTPAFLDADPTRFVQIVSNVLHNAVKFTDPGGRITIAAEVTADNGDWPTVVLRIRDSGIGISQETLPRVFELFVQDEATAHRSHTGLGIGLALARHLIEMHGGSIEAHSDGSGCGSTFTLRMPVAREPATVGHAAPPQAAPRINRRVVVIDDNPAAARALQRLVTALGGECRVAHNGETGLAHVREFRPDVIILDIGMPRLDGYETCRRIRQEFGSEVIVVALTGWGQERDKERAMQAGFDVHLTKPADPVVLEGLLATA